MSDDHEETFDEIQIQVNPYEEDDEIFDRFAVDLDPIAHAEFTRRLLAKPAGEWVRVVDLLEGLAQVPDGAEQIKSQMADQAFACHLPWVGADANPDQPKHTVLLGNTKTMGLMPMLISGPDEI